jgi:hypothetical protein
MKRLASIARLVGPLARGARRHPAPLRAAAAWALLLVYAYAVPPRGWLAIATGYLLLTVALVWTLVPACRAVGERLLPEPLRGQERRLARRHGVVLALLIVGNLALAVARVWSPAVAVVAVMALGVEETWAWAAAKRR